MDGWREGGRLRGGCFELPALMDAALVGFGCVVGG